MRPETRSASTWHEANQRYLVAKLKVLSSLLAPEPTQAEQARKELAEATAAMPAKPALEVLAATFGLSSFERELLLLCAGVELDSRFAELCATTQGGSRRPQPTFSLALAVLPEAHWSALGPQSPLRRFHLIELGPGESLTRGPLRIDERVLHFLVGVEQLDERLMELLEPVAPTSGHVSSLQRVSGQILELWRHTASRREGSLVELRGGSRRARRDIASGACTAMGLRLLALDAHALARRADLELVGRLLAREVLLGGNGLLVEADGLEEAEPSRLSAVGRLIDQMPGPVLVSTRDRLQLGSRFKVSLEVPRPSPEERSALWRQALAVAMARGGDGEATALDEALLELLAYWFDLEPMAIQEACAIAVSASSSSGGLGAALWESCRVVTRPGLEGLAERIEPAGAWEDLVLPEPSLAQLRHIAATLRHTARVHGAWGFSEQSARGLGVGALFVGPSGTGKTLAAEVLAAELRLDLYRIDLSQVVSKYIGETEKNLRRIFEAAERGSAILLFDEADALFGRRGEVRDSLDRYANMEVAYLLQRMETYRGLAILTTNLENAIDSAFLRRLRFVVRFPLPGEAERIALWQRAFPSSTPTEGLDFVRLAQMGLTGGNIRSIALRAAFLAAEAGTPVLMTHALEAAQAEYEKLGRTPGRQEPR